MTPRTIYYVAASLDGFIADERHGLTWLLGLDSPAARAHYEAFIAGVGALAMGSKTYEFVRRELPDAWPYAGLPTWVFTRRALTGFPGADIRFVQGDVAPAHAQMRATAAASGRPSVWLVGGGDLVAQHAALGLVDELQLAVAPVFLGRGVPLLPATILEPLELVSARSIDRIFAELVYRWPHATNRSGAPLIT